MNSLPDTLNVWADHALRFAWPMLWQSSLLIVLLFALDLVLRRKLRPAVRYALWLVVLVKLLLPPSLAFPTGPGWWLRQAKAAPARPLPATPVVVTYDVPTMPMPSVAATPVFIAPPPPPPRLTPASWTLVGMTAVSLGLLAWMLVRWYQVAREARRAAAAPAWLSELLPERRHSARLRLIDSPQSPAVCGLFRPVILLPRSLAEHLPPAQLRAVLLHELHHLRRGDVWVNCVQALVQILYWWHPLLWLANARIRRVREEAVDDAVMLALKEEADTYAPTLLQVAKLALYRPLATLGLVGILESRSSLRQRIERLVDFRPPRKAGLTLGSALAVLGFAALAVPMGEAPATNGVPQVPESQVVTNAAASDDSSSSGLRLDRKAKISRLVDDGKLLYEMGRLDAAEFKLEEALKEDPQNIRASYYLQIVREAPHERHGGLRKVLPRPRPDVAHTNKNRQAIVSKLYSIRFDQVSFDGQPLSEVIRFLADESRQRDPEKHGINFLVNQPMDRGATNAAVKLGPDGQPLPPGPAEQVDTGAISIRINPPLTNIRLGDLLDAIVKVAGRPIKYSIESHAIAFSALQDNAATSLYVRAFKVDTNSFYQSLQRVGAKVGTDDFDKAMQRVGTFPLGNATNSGAGGGAVVFVKAITAAEVVSRAAMNYFQRLGVDLDSMVNPGKALFFNDRQGKLLVKGTLQDLDIVEQALAAAGVPTEQVPATGAARQPTAGQGVTNGLVSDGLPNPGLTMEQRIKASTLMHDVRLLYEMGKLDQAEAKLKLALKEDPHNQAAIYYMNQIAEAKSARANPTRPRERLTPPNPNSRTNALNSSADRQAILTKLDRIRLDTVSFDRLPLSEVVRYLADESRKRDPEKRGINFLLTLKLDSDAQAAAATLGPDGQPLPTAPAEQVDVAAISINLNPPLTNMRLADVLDAIVKVADRPIKYAIEDYAIVFSTRGHETPPLYVRTFRVDPTILIEKLHVAMGPVATNGPERVTQAMLDYFAQAGVDLDLRRNPGRNYFYHPAPTRLEGMLLVRAPLQELDIVERAIAALGIPTGQAPAPGVARQPPAGQVVSESRPGEANPIKRELLPVPNPYAPTNVVHLSTGRQTISNKLDRIRFDSFAVDGLPLTEAVLFLSDESRKRDPDKRGINFLLNQNIVTGANAAAPTLGPDGHPLPAAQSGQVDLNAITIKINPPLTNIRLADALDAIVKVADQPIKYSIEEYAIVFSARDPKAIPLYVRSFKVDPSTLAQGLDAKIPPGETDSRRAITQALANYFKSLGVDLDPKPNQGKSIYLNDRQGMLLVRATLHDLDIIEAALQLVATAPPQINLKCKIVEVSQDDTKALGFDWYLGPIITNSSSTGGHLGTAPTYTGAPTAANPLGAFPGSPQPISAIPSGSNSYLSAVRQPGSDGQPFTLTGILTDPQYRMVIKALQQRNGTELLGAPSVTTQSGRQAQCKSTSTSTIINGIKQQALTPPGITSTNNDASSVFQQEPMEFGWILDVVPTVMADGYTISLPVDVTVFGFAGYDNPGTNRVAVYLNGEQKWVTPPRPKVQKRQVAATVNIWDGQTLVLGGQWASINDANNTPKRNLIIFVTPTLIDPAGNRVHTDEEMPFARDGSPPQPTR